MKTLIFVALFGLCLSENVDRILQNFDEKTNSRISQQITYELQASYLYQAYSHYFGRSDVALPGFAKWFEKQSLEERKHATSLIEYVNKRGGSVSLADVHFNSMCDTISEALRNTVEFGRSKACICSFMSHKTDKAASKECGNRSTWKNGLWAMQDTLVLERFVNTQLLTLHQNADSDPHLSHVLEHEFLDEQVESIKNAGDMIRKLERVGDGLGEYIFDKEL